MTIRPIRGPLCHASQLARREWLDLIGPAAKASTPQLSQSSRIDRPQASAEGLRSRAARKSQSLLGDRVIESPCPYTRDRIIRLPGFKGESCCAHGGQQVKAAVREERRLSIFFGTLVPFAHFLGNLDFPPEEHMEQLRGQGEAELSEPLVPGVSWASVLAGAAASCAMTLVMLSFGAGVGFSVVSPWGGSGVSATTFEIGTGLYFIVMAMISSAIGGYLAGRLRTKWVGLRTTEVQFRDTAHGFLAWAVASVLGALLLASPASSLVGGAVSGVTQAAANSTQSSSPMDGYVDTLLRSDNSSAQGQQNPSDARGELVRLLTTSFRNGADLNPADRAYVIKVVSVRTGLSQADAEKRVNDVVTQVKADLDKARKTAMQTAIWLTLSLFIGAFSAALAAMEGGGLRDGTWGKRGYERTATVR
jgi:hypothetical protein